jgi:hypothetical protein
MEETKMIIKGIIDPNELQSLRAAARRHGLSEGVPGEFRVWEDESALWVELDVHESLMVYLVRSGFFEPAGEKQDKTTANERKR